MLALLAFVTFRGCFGGSTVSWNQRLTLVIETPQGEVRGSAVTRVENRTTRDLLAPGKALRSTLTGEAVAVEVLPGRWLFALLQGEDATGAGGWVYAAFDLRAAVGSDGYPSYDESMRKLRALSLDEPAPLPKEAMPLLVTFDDITRPETVREVGPGLGLFPAVFATHEGNLPAQLVIVTVAFQDGGGQFVNQSQVIIRIVGEVTSPSIESIDRQLFETHRLRRTFQDSANNLHRGSAFAHIFQCH